MSKTVGILERRQVSFDTGVAHHTHICSRSVEFIVSSLELAYEYAKLGKLKRATSVFNTALDIVRNMETSPEVGAFFLLRFAETLALMNDVPRR